MMTKKQAVSLTKSNENLVYTSVQDIAYLIQLHSELGISELEVFIVKSIAKKCIKVLENKKFYCKIFEFKSLEHECRLYISWISTL
jgi:hypothetical protein